MSTSTPSTSNLRLPVRIAEGTRGKLDFDYACGRGHSFGEDYIHGVVNEILCSGLDPTRHRVHSGYPHPALQAHGAAGRRREVDFAVETLGPALRSFYAEVKWAGSSHCNQENILRDLCRLQIIKNLEPFTECVFVLAGRLAEVDKLFSSGILAPGTSGPLHRSGADARLTEGGRRRRIKNFSLNGNADHARVLEGMAERLSGSLPDVETSDRLNWLLGAGMAQYLALQVVLGLMGEDGAWRKQASRNRASELLNLAPAKWPSLDVVWDLRPDSFHLALDGCSSEEFAQRVGAITIFAVDADELHGALLQGSQRVADPFSPGYRGKTALLVAHLEAQGLVTPPLVRHLPEGLFIEGGNHRVGLARYRCQGTIPILMPTAEATSVQPRLRTFTTWP